LNLGFVIVYVVYKMKQVRNGISNETYKVKRSMLSNIYKVLLIGSFFLHLCSLNFIYKAWKNNGVESTRKQDGDSVFEVEIGLEDRW